MQETDRAASLTDADRCKQGRVLVWHDEFDAAAIDPEKWTFQRTMNVPGVHYDNGAQNIRMEDGKLLMQIHRSAATDPDRPFTTCEGFTTAGRMNWRYGYLEMRAKIPFVRGSWPSFWTKSRTPFQKSAWMCETDIFEVFTGDAYIVPNLHKWGAGKHCSYPCQSAYQDKALKLENREVFKQDYHVYGYEWNPDYMAFFVDGTEYRRFPIDPAQGNFHPEILDGVDGFHDFQFIILNNEVFSPFDPNCPAGKTLRPDDDFPIDYRVDWMRLYQDPAKEQIRLRAEIEAAQAERDAKTNA